MAAYAEAVEGQQPIEIGVKRSPAGSVAATVGLYLGSTAFANLAAETQHTRRNILEEIARRARIACSVKDVTIYGPLKNG